MGENKIYMEHANITVSNLDDSIRFFTTAFPNFKVRGGGESNGRKWLHLGDDTTYLALNSSVGDQPKKETGDYGIQGINHIGFVVNNVAEIADRLLAAGYERDYPKQIEQFRIRDYFADADGNEFEFVEYLSDDISERNSFA